MNSPLPFHLLAKPTGAVCNLDCKYCFYLSKETLYPESPSRMSDDVLETYVRQLLAAQRGLPEVSVSWQGGEPTLMGLDFFRRAVAVVERYKAPGQRVQHTMQTNGVLLNDEWAAFLKEHDFLVGLSIDGPKAMHDAYRVAKGGQGTYEQVMRAWKGLSRHGVETNILCTVHAANGDHGLDVYRFFRDELGAKFIQFIPIVERADENTIEKASDGWGARRDGERPFYSQHGDLVTERSVRPDQYGRFLSDIFDEWIKADVGTIFVQSFDAALANWIGQPSMCIFSPTCGNALALEHNGDLYACDHYVEPDYLLGNIADTDMAEMVISPRQRQFGRDKLDTLPRQCRECEVLFACYGECPRNRFLKTEDGEPGLNYLCAGYRQFFNHVDRPMQIMAGLLSEGRFADEIMGMQPDQA
ncbi:MAG: anaerobic sulfatase maturase [Rhodobiaceae bacterium]|nr:anaerobic sulfatase maturase [Rhodobiaceae bacterium]